MILENKWRFLWDLKWFKGFINTNTIVCNTYYVCRGFLKIYFNAIKNTLNLSTAKNSSTYLILNILNVFAHYLCSNLVKSFIKIPKFNAYEIKIAFFPAIEA